MVKAKLTDQEKEDQFNNWLSGNESEAINKFISIRGSVPALEMGLVDISSDYTPYLTAMYQMVQELKVPGRKAKSYEQQYVRTMFQEKKEAVEIDGNVYPISNGSMVEIWNCKECVVEIFNYTDPERIDMERTYETYQGWKKELIKHCKEFDKIYVKHMGSKGAYNEMHTLHMSAMKPLIQLSDANLNFHQLEMMIKDKKDVPEFRVVALEEQFCLRLTGICEIFKDFGSLEDHFDIKQMLKVLKIEDWQTIEPFKHFLNPLNTSISAVRGTLLKMDKLGPLRMKYKIEANKELQDGVIQMVKKDITAQWLVGDEVKQDQFNFLYEVIRVIYDSALRDKLINRDPIIMETVIPNLCALKSVLVIRNIQLRKAQEAKHEKDKAEREGRPVEEEKQDPRQMTEEDVVAQRLENEKTGGNSMSEAQKEQALEEAERKKYGRHWVWDGYFNERNKEQWLTTAEQLKHINNMVLQDVEDFIILKAFKGVKPDKIRQIIDDDHQTRMIQNKRLLGKDGDEWFNKQKIESKKRRFMNSIRPPHYWNFFEEGAEEMKVKHVLRYNAKPTESYIDGRVESVLQQIEEIGHNLMKYEETKWKLLLKYTLEIFAQQFEDFKIKLEQS